MNRTARSALIVLILTLLVSAPVRGQGNLNNHPVQLDASGKLLAWPATQENAYDQVLGLATNYLLNGVPTASNGLKMYYTQSYMNPGNPPTAAGWPHNPAGLYSMLTDSGLLYFAYSGNTAMTDLVRNILTYQLDHGMTPAGWDWPNVAYASADAGALTYQGAAYGNAEGRGDGTGVIEPDKVGEIGVAFLKYYEFSGDVRFRDAAIQAADVLADHVRTGNATQSPWPFRVYAQTNSIREDYSAHVISPIQLFDELIRLNLGNVAAYQPARQTAWNWLMTYPMQNNVWDGYFEDIWIQATPTNRNQLNAAETARYLMRHPEFDPNWQAHVRGIIAWIEGRFAVPQFGANSIAEQDLDTAPMGSHTSRYGSLNAQLYELTGDQAAKEKAYRSLNWASYMCGTNGIVIDGPIPNGIWFTDGYGDYIKHFMEGLGSVPEWAPPGQTHLLRSTSVVRSVQYAPTDVTYQVFDGSAQEVLRLNFTPQSVTADGILLPDRDDLTQEGWTFDASTGVMRVRHDSGTQFRISSSVLGNNTPPSVSLNSPISGSFFTPISFDLRATANDPDGTISHVEFLNNGSLFVTATAFPYDLPWTSVAPGSYQLTAVAVDNQGARTTSNAISLIVSVPPPPTNLVTGVSGNAVTLVWSPPSGGPPIANYGVFRSTTSGFTPTTGNLVAQPTDSSFSDEGVSPGTYYYRVVAFQPNGNPSGSSNEATATISGGLRVDKVVFSDGASTRTSPAFSTSAPGELLLAFGASDGPQSGGQTLTVTGAGLTWTLVKRIGTQPGSSEIWQAVAPSVLTNVTVTSTPSRAGFDQSLMIVAFIGAGGTGASATASGVSAPLVPLTTIQAGSLVYGVGNDWDNSVARTLGDAQAIVHQWVDTAAGDTFWVQSKSAPGGVAGSHVQLNDVAPTSDRWNMAAVEITPVVPLVSVPDTAGQTQAAAQSLIAGANLVVGAVANVPSLTAPINTVISQTPAGGVQVLAGSAINLVISSGLPAATLTRLSINTPIVVGGTPLAGTVTLDVPAPPGGVQVALSSDNPAVLVAPSVTVEAGAMSATFLVTTAPVTTITAAGITGTYNATHSASLVIDSPMLAAISLDPANVTGGNPSIGTATLTGPAPAGGIVVMLSANDQIAAGLVGVHTPSGLPNSGSIDWSIVGPVFSAVNSGTITPVAGSPGLNVTLTTATGLPLMMLTNCAAGDDCGWWGNFAPGASVLWTGGTYDGNTGWWAPNGPLTIGFDSPQRGVGFQTMADEGGPFTATLCAYNAADTLLGCVPFTGNGTTAGDGSASFMGLYDDVQEISRVTIDAGGTLYPHDFAISQLFVTGARRQAVPVSVIVPEGAATATFAVNTNISGTATSFTVTGRYVATQTANLTVNTPVLSTVTLDTASVVGGTSLTGTVTLTGAAPAGGAIVALSADNAVATGIQGVTSTTGLPQDGIVNWLDLGPPSTSVDSGTAAPVTGISGLNVTLSSASGDPLMIVTNCPAIANCGFWGNFVPAAPLLRTSGHYDDNGAWAGNGPLTIALSTPQRGLGFRIMADETGPFTGTVCAYDQSDVQLGCVPISGDGATFAGGINGLAAYVGVYDDVAEISKVTIDAGGALYPHDFAIANLAIATSRRMVATSITVPAGASTATFPVNTDAVSAPTSVTITGDYYGARTGTLNIYPAAVLSGDNLPQGQ